MSRPTARALHLMTAAGCTTALTATLLAATPAQAVPAQQSTGSDEIVTLIVQLDGTNAGIPWYQRIFGVDASERHEAAKDRLLDIAHAQAPAEKPQATDASTAGPLDQSVKESAQSHQAATTDESSTQDEKKIGEVADYYHALDGFAINVPASAVDQIRNADGVKNVFVEQVHYLPAPVTDEATSTLGTPGLNSLNDASLAMTHSDSLSYTGKGQLIAVIDSGLDTSHPAFSGQMDADSLALTKGEQATRAAAMNEGKTGTYVSDKIPFVYDYADHDNNVLPPATADMSHGTHVAGIAAANADTIRGTAPDA